MSQESILQVLEKHKEDLSSKQISDKLKLSRTSVGRALKKLKDQNLVYDYKIKKKFYYHLNHKKTRK